MEVLSKIIDQLTAAIGKAVSWLALVLVFLIIGDVFFRYAFNKSAAWTAELEWHLFSLLFLLAAGWTLQADRHVRVDVFYQRFSGRTKKVIDLIGCLALLLPFCIVGFWESLGFVSSAYAFQETSSDPGGLPMRFLIKAAIPSGFFLLGLQGLSIVIKNILSLRK